MPTQKTTRRTSEYASHKKVGDRQKCNLCGRQFKLEANKMNAKYCNKCKYSPERRKK